MKIRSKSGNVVADSRPVSGPVNKRWYVVANRTEAAMYEGIHSPKFVKRLSNPNGRLHESELDSDRPGKSCASASSTIHHALDKGHIHHEKAARDFADVIASKLSSARDDERLAEIVLVSEPHFLGLLRDAFPESLKPLVKHEVNREYGKQSKKDLFEHINAALSRKE